MPTLILHRRVTRQPQGSARINPKHWLAPYIAFAWDGRRGYVWHKPVAPLVQTLIAPASRFGEVIQPDGAGYVSFNVPGLTPDGISLACWAAAVAGTTDRAIFSVGNGLASDGIRGLFLTAAEAWSMRRSNSAAAQSGQSQAGWSSGVWQHLIGVQPLVSSSGCYVNGVGSTASGNSRAMSAANLVTLAAWRQSGSYAAISDSSVLGVGPGMVLTKIPDADEIPRIYQEALADPWSIWSPRPVFVWMGGGTLSLVIADAAHGHAADGIVLTAAAALAVADATHAHIGDALTLSTGTALAPADAGHAHAADAIAISAQSALGVADAAHVHVADNLTLSATGAAALSIADAGHAHAADGLALTTASALAVADALHSHTVDGLTLSAASVLAIQEALHAHAADGLTLTAGGAPALLLADSLHAHTADGVLLSVAAWLLVADAAHGHAADLVLLSTALPPAIPSAPPIGHRLATGRRTPTMLALRGPNLSTRTR